jgi:hypothetical protein
MSNQVPLSEPSVDEPVTPLRAISSFWGEQKR